MEKRGAGDAAVGAAAKRARASDSGEIGEKKSRREGGREKEMMYERER